MSRPDPAKAIEELSKWWWEYVVELAKGESEMFPGPRFGIGGRYIGGTWHASDCMCPVCLQAVVDTINAVAKPEELRCECGALKTGEPAHSSWCPLYAS